jgi:hypothetical protein
MKPWLIIPALLAGCSGQATLTSGWDQDRTPFNLDEAAAEMERRCDLAEGSLLRVTPRGDLELRATTQSLTYPQFSCVMAAIEQAKLEKRGVRVILIGEDAAR